MATPCDARGERVLHAFDFGISLRGGVLRAGIGRAASIAESCAALAWPESMRGEEGLAALEQSGVGQRLLAHRRDIGFHRGDLALHLEATSPFIAAIAWKVAKADQANKTKAAKAAII